MISSLMILTAMAMFTFPKNLKGNRIPPPIKMREIEAQKKLEKQDEDSKPKLKDFPKTIKRQLSNDILMFRTASSVSIFTLGGPERNTKMYFLCSTGTAFTSSSWSLHISTKIFGITIPIAGA